MWQTSLLPLYCHCIGSNFAKDLIVNHIFEQGIHFEFEYTRNQIRSVVCWGDYSPLLITMPSFVTSVGFGR